MQIKDFFGLGAPGRLPEGVPIPAEFLEKVRGAVREGGGRVRRVSHGQDTCTQCNACNGQVQRIKNDARVKVQPTRGSWGW